MPNTAKTRTGKSWKERAAIARQMTAEQQGRSADVAAVKAAADKDAKDAKDAKGKDSAKSRRRGKAAHAKKPERAKASGPRFGMGARVLAGVAGALVVCAFILYPVGQTYYKSLRDEQRLEAQLAAINARNDALRESNEALNTDEGVEAKAREDLGWVKKGEQAAIVTNPSENEGSESVPEQVNPDEVKAPETWYYNILDAVFFVQR